MGTGESLTASPPTGGLSTAPLLVIGTGGSGTRIAGELMRDAGVYLGPELNRASDSRAMTRFLRLHSVRYLLESGWLQPDSGADRRPEAPSEELAGELSSAMERLRAETPPAQIPWGWKNPPTIYVLPLIDAVAPGCVVVHMIRDGRDMAYSSNQNQLAVYGDALIPELAGEPEPVRSTALWSRVNLGARAFGERFMGGRYLVVRYEDLCADPRAEAAGLLRHLGIEAGEDLLDRAVARISASPSTGRWKSAPQGELERVLAAGETALAAFGYGP